MNELLTNPWIWLPLCVTVSLLAYRYTKQYVSRTLQQHAVIIKRSDLIHYTLRVAMLDKFTDVNDMVFVLKQTPLQTTIENILREADILNMPYTEVAYLLNRYTRSKRFSWLPLSNGIQLTTPTGDINFAWLTPT